MREAAKIFLFKSKFFVQNIKFVVKYLKGPSKKFKKKMGRFLWPLGAPSLGGPRLDPPCSPASYATAISVMLKYVFCISAYYISYTDTHRSLMHNIMLHCVA
jgi:hypothetical protein